MTEIKAEQFRKPKRAVSKVFLHCSASDYPQHDNIETITAWHKARGFSTIGYHFFITKAGKILGGRDLEQVPAAQKGHNTGSIAICCHGLKKELFTAAQRASLHALCEKIYEEYGGRVTYHGHHEVDPGKECPVFDYKEWLNLDPWGNMVGAINKPLETKTWTNTQKLPAQPLASFSWAEPPPTPPTKQQPLASNSSKLTSETLPKGLSPCSEPSLWQRVRTLFAFSRKK